ncbi:MAG: stage III sporulation protein AF [Clostridia bacterium]|nr:stage III sporulation protein AF [Clostridia bacterium]
MINYISSWAEQVIICVIVVTILEMILPNGNSKKYIKTIIGVYILYTIISPGIKLITGSDLKIDYSKYEKYFNTEEVGGKIEGITVEDTYKVEIEKQMKSDIESMGYNVEKVTIDFNLEKGVIKNVSLLVNKDVKEEKNKNEVDISVDKIEIGKQTISNTLTNSEIRQIKQKINENYGVDYKDMSVNSI